MVWVGRNAPLGGAYESARKGHAVVCDSGVKACASPLLQIVVRVDIYFASDQDTIHSSCVLARPNPLGEYGEGGMEGTRG